MYALAALSLAAGALVSALPEKLPVVGVTFEDTFDSYNASTYFPVPHLRPVGTYNGIKYEGWIVAKPFQAPKGSASIVPPSSPNYAAATAEVDVIQLGSFNLDTYGNLVKGDNITSFDLNSFYFACATDDGSTAGAAQGCTISLVGYYIDGTQTPTVSYSYSPQHVTNAPFVEAVLPPTYSALQNVSVGVANGAVFTERTAIALDNVVHTNHL